MTNALSLIEREPFDSWLHRINQACGHFGASTLGASFQGGLRDLRCGAIELSVVEMASVRLFRTAREVRAGGDHFYMVLQLGGSAGVEQAGRRLLLERGDITLVDARQPCDMTYTQAARQLSLILPRATVERGLRCTQFRALPHVQGDQPVARLAKGLIQQALEQPDLCAQDSEATLDALLALLNPALTRSEPRADHGERLLRKALDYIDRHLAVEDLCPELIARAVGVSVRGLYRLFAKEGLVVAQYIKHRRLDHCAQLLRSGAGEQKLSALGYACGFADSSYFSTAFKARFGATPGEYRRRYR